MDKRAGIPDHSDLALLVLTPSIAPREDSESLVNTKIVTALGDCGIRAEVISRRTNPASPAVCDAPDSLLSDKGMPRYHMPFPRLRQCTKELLGLGNTQRLRLAFESQWAARATVEAIRIFEERRYDAVLAFGGFCQLPALTLKRKLGVPFISVWNDPFPSYCAPAPYGQGKAFAQIPGAYRTMMSKVASEASYHVFPSTRLRDFMLDLLPGVSPGQTRVLPHMASRRPLHGCRADSVLTITHAGGLMPYRPIAPFLEAVARLKSAGQADFPIRLRFIGPQGPEISRVAAKFGVADICDLVPEIPNSRSFRLLCESDIILVVEAMMPESIFLPYKFVESVETARPIFAVTPPRSVIGDLITQHGGGWPVSCLSVDEIAAGLRSVCRAWQRRVLDGFSSGRLRPVFEESRVAPEYVDLVEAATAEPVLTGDHFTRFKRH